MDCNHDALAGFAAAHGLVRLTISQRSIHVLFPYKSSILQYSSTLPKILTMGDRLVASRKEAGLKQKELAEKSGIPRKWIGRWERDLAIPSAGEWEKLAAVMKSKKL